MKLKEFLDDLNAKVEKDKSLLDMAVVYAGDDEGNYFNEVNFLPTPGHIDECSGFTSVEDKDMEEPVNAICIN